MKGAASGAGEGWNGVGLGLGLEVGRRLGPRFGSRAELWGLGGAHHLLHHLLLAPGELSLLS